MGQAEPHDFIKTCVTDSHSHRQSREYPDGTNGSAPSNTVSVLAWTLPPTMWATTGPLTVVGHELCAESRLNRGRGAHVPCSAWDESVLFPLLPVGCRETALGGRVGQGRAVCWPQRRSIIATRRLSVSWAPQLPSNRKSGGTGPAALGLFGTEKRRARIPGSWRPPDTTRSRRGHRHVQQEKEARAPSPAVMENATSGTSALGPVAFSPFQAHASPLVPGAVVFPIVVPEARAGTVAAKLRCGRMGPRWQSRRRPAPGDQRESAALGLAPGSAGVPGTAAGWRKGRRLSPCSSSCRAAPPGLDPLPRTDQELGGREVLAALTAGNVRYVPDAR
jgi:hypothetical protein